MKAMVSMLLNLAYQLFRHMNKVPRQLLQQGLMISLRFPSLNKEAYENTKHCQTESGITDGFAH